MLTAICVAWWRSVQPGAPELVIDYRGLQATAAAPLQPPRPPRAMNEQSHPALPAGRGGAPRRWPEGGGTASAGILTIHEVTLIIHKINPLNREGILARAHEPLPTHSLLTATLRRRSPRRASFCHWPRRDPSTRLLSDAARGRWLTGPAVPGDWWAVLREGRAGKPIRCVRLPPGL